MMGRTRDNEQALWARLLAAAWRSLSPAMAQQADPAVDLANKTIRLGAFIQPESCTGSGRRDGECSASC